jgi:hypothetical protein
MSLPPSAERPTGLLREGTGGEVGRGHIGDFLTACIIAA